MMHDHPIRSPEEDTLGESRFAERLAEKILELETRTGSTTVGIVAPWGYGKTSILNLMEKVLNKRKNNNLLVFDFNPWIYSKRSNLTSEYIQTLENKLDLKNENETWQDLAEVLKELLPLLTPPLWKKCVDFVTKHPKWIWFMVLIIVVYLFVYQQLFHFVIMLEPFKEYLASLPLWFSLFLEATLAFYPKCKIKMQRLLHITTTNLEDCLNHINQSLEGKKVIVFIDDIDRLPADEVMDILRMVKSICNFTNCIYVLAYDEDYIVKAIEEACNNNKGEEYLEKIVSFPYKLPERSHRTLTKFLKDELKNIVEPHHFQQLVNTVHCIKLFEALVPLYLKTPRKIKRLLNAFNTSYLIAGTNLHWGDLLTIEAIKLYNQEAYKVISQNKYLYLKTIENQMAYELNKMYPSNTDTSIEDKRASLVPDPQERALVDLLLPQFGGRTPDDAYEERRVSHHLFFDNYFHIELNNTVLSEKEIQVLINTLDKSTSAFFGQVKVCFGEDKELFENTFRTLIRRISSMNDLQKNTLLEWCLNSLDEYTGEQQSTQNYGLFEDLFVNLLNPTGDRYRYFDIDIDFEALQKQFYQWLCRLQNIEILTRFISSIQKKDFYRFLNNLEFSEKEMNHLKQLTVKQFQTLIEDEAYFQSKHPIPMLFLEQAEEWEKSTNETPYKEQWFEKAKAHPSVLSQIVYRFQTFVWNSGSEAGVIKMQGTDPNPFHNGIERSKPRPQEFLDWLPNPQEAIEFLPQVIDYCKTHAPEKVPFMEQFFKELSNLSP